LRLHYEFEWDPRKAAANWKKHSVRFDEAAVVLADDEGDAYHVDEPDEEHSVVEDRRVTFGSRPDDRRVLLRITWTDRSGTDEQVTRIISARRATNQERKRYAQEISDR